MRLGCSSRFRILSQTESKSRILWSMMSAGGLTPGPPAPGTRAPSPRGSPLRERFYSPAEGGPPGEGGARHPSTRIQGPTPLTVSPPGPHPFRGRAGEKKPVKRKRDLFPGSRTASQGSPWRCRQLNAPLNCPSPSGEEKPGTPRGGIPSPREGTQVPPPQARPAFPASQQQRQSGIRSTIPAPEY
jgi:hypothetical protein